MYNNDWNSQFSIQRSVKSNTYCTYKGHHFHTCFSFSLMTRWMGTRWIDLFVYLFINLLYTNINLLWFSDQIFKFSANFDFCFFILPQYRHFPPFDIHCSLQKQTLKYLPIFGCKIDFSTCQMIIVPTVILCSVHLLMVICLIFFH